MRGMLFVVGAAVAVLAVAVSAQPPFQTDAFKTSAGELQLTFIGHGTLMMRFGAVVVHIDPVSQYADYGTLPKADVVLVTHEHGDHLDPKAIAAVGTAKAIVIGTATCAAKVPGMIVMKNGESREAAGIRVEAVPAYNLAAAFHPKGQGNGYILEYGGKRVYVAGDTENTPEMKALTNIDIAFLPMNLPYTMTPEMVADAARAFKPKVLYPYHFGSTDTSKLVALMAGTPGVEVRIRNLK
jgi:L-ascorbate metabolism protein UlaG (beta-lactamase superfamily)